MENLDSGGYRKQLVEAAKVFKSNWVQFGELLTKVASDKLYESWGYKNFETYCQKEIRIKRNTAIKLTNAYFFMTTEDPDIFKRSASNGNLDLDAVNFLIKAKNDENCSPDIYEELKESALEQGQSGTSLARKFKKLTQNPDQDAGEEFQHQNLKLIGRLQQRLKPLDDIPVRFKEYLNEMEVYFSSN